MAVMHCGSCSNWFRNVMAVVVWRATACLLSRVWFRRVPLWQSSQVGRAVMNYVLASMVPAVRLRPAAFCLGRFSSWQSSQVRVGLVEYRPVRAVKSGRVDSSPVTVWTALL